MGEVLRMAVYRNFNEHECWVCGVPFAITQSLELAKRRDHATLYCPNGCQLGLGESESDKLRKQLADKERQIIAERERAHTNFTARLKAEKKLKKVEKRAACGVCPECNRTFVALGRHMKTKHPDFVAEARQ